MNMNVCANARRLGFTLIELLVVIAIIAILMAILVPAVQKVREAANKMSCENNLHQIGIAIHDFAGENNRFPHGGWRWEAGPTYNGPNTSVPPPQPLGGKEQMAGWMYQILPYLERDALYKTLDCPPDLSLLAGGPTQQYWYAPCWQAWGNEGPVARTAISTYFCPSRRAPTRGFNGRAKNDYAVCSPGSQFRGPNNTRADQPNGPTGAQVNATLNAFPYYGAIARNNDGWAAAGLYFPDLGRTGFHSLIDGSSNIILVSEKRMHTNQYMGDSWHDNEGYLCGWDPDIMRTTLLAPEKDIPEGSIDPLDPTWTLGFQFGSAHPGGINILFGDGHVRTAGYNIDRLLFWRLGHVRDGAHVDLTAIAP